MVETFGICNVLIYSIANQIDQDWTTIEFYESAYNHHVQYRYIIMQWSHMTSTSVYVAIVTQYRNVNGIFK